MKSCCAAFVLFCVAVFAQNPATSCHTGAGEGIRTPDPLITNQMLYQLSYASLVPSAPGDTKDLG